MIYNVTINPAKKKQFLKAMEILRDLDVIKSIQLNDIRSALTEGEESDFVENFDPELLLKSLHDKKNL